MQEKKQKEYQAVDLYDCIHGLGFKSNCTICNGKDAKRKKEEEGWHEFWTS